MTVRRYLLVAVLIISSCNIDSSFLAEDVVVSSSGRNEYHIDHNRWTYEMMSQHYFWADELPDSISLDFSTNPRRFFEMLLSSQDRFSWCEANQGYIDEELGFHYQTYEIGGCQVSRVLYVYSPLLIDRGLKRGDYVVIKDSIIEKGYCQKGRFIPTDRICRNLITKGQNLAPTVSFDSIYVVSGKKIGYFVYDQFESSTDINQIAIKLKNLCVDELILDLRYNPGGYVHTSKHLASLLVPKNCMGELYQLQRYNNTQTNLKTNMGESGVDSIYLDKGIVTSNINLDLKKLIVLTTKNTASASEALIIGLRPYMNVVTIGTPSCGKDVGSYTIANNRYKYRLQPITFRYYNALNDSTPITGIVPNVIVRDDLTHERGDTNEALLNAAIKYLTGQHTSQQNDFVGVETVEYGKSSIEHQNNL